MAEAPAEGAGDFGRGHGGCGGGRGGVGDGVLAGYGGSVFEASADLGGC